MTITAATARADALLAGREYAVDGAAVLTLAATAVKVNSVRVSTPAD